MLEWNFFRKSKNFINNTLNLFWLLAFLAFGVTVGIAYLGPQNDNNCHTWLCFL